MISSKQTYSNLGKYYQRRGSPRLAMYYYKIANSTKTQDEIIFKRACLYYSQGSKIFAVKMFRELAHRDHKESIDICTRIDKKFFRAKDYWYGRNKHTLDKITGYKFFKEAADAGHYNAYIYCESVEHNYNQGRVLLSTDLKQALVNLRHATNNGHERARYLYQIHRSQCIHICSVDGCNNNKELGDFCRRHVFHFYKNSQYF